MENSRSRNSNQQGHSPYEQEFAAVIGPGAEAFSFWKGRVALYAILQALGIQPGDEVILPGYTCVVVANAIRFLGATPIYVDIYPGTYHINPQRVVEAITSRTRAILVQHTYGIPGPVEEVMSIANPLGIPVIEDSAHSLGSSVDGIHVGQFGKAAFFSSQWSKPYSTGLGGMAVTSDKDLARQLEKVYLDKVIPPIGAQTKLWAQLKGYQNFYSPKVYWQAQSFLHSLSGLGLFVGSSSDDELKGSQPVDHSWRMSSFQQNAGRLHLKNIEKDYTHRRDLADWYDQVLCDHGWNPAYRHGDTILLRYPVQVGNKEELMALAKRAHIEIGSWFETPLHPIPLEKHSNFGYDQDICPNAELAAQQVVNLPMHRWINDEESSRIVNFFLKYARLPEPVFQKASKTRMR